MIAANSAVTRREFGQEQPLSVALHNLVKEYPLGPGIFKEFIQNADDAGASEIRFILDYRSHATSRLSHGNQARLNGPALLVCNDKTFSDDDLENIQTLGDSRKAVVPSKIGRFGLGFNSCYNVTDHPMLLTGGSLFLFDPHRSADDYTGRHKPGSCWDLAELWQKAPDLILPFLAGGLKAGESNFGATIFRLPLRSQEQAAESKIRNEPCPPETIRRLIGQFATFAPSILLFLRSVAKFSFCVVSGEGQAPEELLSVVTLNPDEIAESRKLIFSPIEGDFEAVLERFADRTEGNCKSTCEHQLVVGVSGRPTKYRWAVSYGLFRGDEDRLFSLSRKMWERREKAIPLAGAAALISLDESEPQMDGSGDVFCFLPLPDAKGGASLPVHLNGFFDVSSSRRGLTHETGAPGTIEALRGEWNQVLVEEGVSSAYSDLLAFAVKKWPDLPADQIYALWPNPAVTLPPPLTGLPAALYKRCSGEPLLRSAKKSWVFPSDLRQIDTSIREPLLADAYERIPDPDIPSHILKGFSAVGKSVPKLQPTELREFYRLDKDLNCELKDAPRCGLSKREWLSALTRFVFKDIDEQKPADVSQQFSGLPFLLTADERLHSFGLQKQNVYLASKEERRIFGKYPDWFIDDEHAKASGLTEVFALRLLKMTADILVLNLKIVSAPDQGKFFRAWDPGADIAPNAAWLSQVLEYLCQQPAKWKPNILAIQTCCLVPDQFGHLHPCGYATTPLLSLQVPNTRLMDALASFDVAIASGPSELLAQFDSLRRRYSGLICPFTATNLLDSLAALASERAGKPAACDCESLLEYLSSPEALEQYEKQLPASLEKIKAFPIFPTEGTELVSLTAEQCYLPSQVQGPPLRLPIKLLKRGPWAGLLKRLNVGELTARSLIEKVLVPSYPKLGSSDQLLVLSWIRDHLDQALTEAGQEQHLFLAGLQKTQVVHSSDGNLHAFGSLYFPGEQLVKDVMGDKGLSPDMSHYCDDRDRWLAFFERLGMSRIPRPQDLADYILVLVKNASADYSEATNRLTVVLQHVIDYWHVLENAAISFEGKATSLRDFMRTQQWCPPLRGQKNLRHLIVAAEPPHALYRLAQLSPPALGHLVGGVRPLMPIKQRDSIPDAVRKLAPEVILPSVDEVVGHFEKILAAYAADPSIEPKDLKAPLRTIYGFFGGLIPHQLPPNPDADNGRQSGITLETEDASPDVQQLRTRLHEKPTIFIDRENRFRPAHEVFFEDVGYAEPWLTQFHYNDSRADLGLAVLGRKREPSLSDLCSLTVDIHRRNSGQLTKPLSQQFLRLLRRINDQLPGQEHASQVFVLDNALATALPKELLFDDAYWLPAALDRSCLRLAHPDLPRALAAKLGMKVLSECLQQRPKELTEADDAAFQKACDSFGQLIRSVEFRRGLQRIILNVNPTLKSPDLRWLSALKISPMARIVTEYLVQRNGEQISLGESQDETLWMIQPQGDSILNVAEAARNVLDVKLAEIIKRRLVSITLEDLYLMKILNCSLPGQIEPLLDQLKLPRLEQNTAPEEAKKKEGSSFLDGESEPAAAASEEFEEEQEQKPESSDSQSAAKKDAAAQTEHQKEPAGEAEADEEDADDDTEHDSTGESGGPDRHRSGNREGRGNGASSGGQRTGKDGHQGSSSESEPGWERMPPGQGGQQEGGQNDRRTSRSKPRGRVVSYVLNDDQAEQAADRHDHADDEVALNKRIGDDAVGWVLQYERQHGRNPDPTNHLRNIPGFDVLSREKGLKPPRYIEVKGIRGGWGLDGVPLSIRQYEFAKEKGDAFWLYVVEYAEEPDEVTIYPIQNPVSHITQYRFDRGWKQLAAAEKPFVPLIPKAGLRIRHGLENGTVREGLIKDVTNSDGTQLLQIAWDDSRHGALVFEPLKVELIPPPSLGSF